MSDYALTEGMAVTHDTYGTGELVSITGQTGAVEFGDLGRTEVVPLADLDVDWEFYKNGTSVHKQ